jgi:glycosyltransferase involved in cell wall biosynthesis
MPGRILIVSPTDSRSGAGLFRHALATALRRAGYAVTIAQPEEYTPIQGREAQLGIEHHFFARNPYDDLVAFVRDEAAAASAVQRAAPDLVVFSSGLSPLCHLPFFNPVARAGLPYLMIEHQVAPHLFAFEPPVRARFAEFHQRASAVVAVSQDNLRVLREALGLPEEVGRVILYGRPDPFFRPRNPAGRAALRREWDVPEDALVALTVAKLEPVKGHEYLIEAMRRLKDEPVWERLFFAWVGDGAARGALEAALADAGVGDHVRLLGHRLDVAPLYDGGDVLVMTSVSEGMPLTVMEGMAKGLPPLCTDVGGTAEAIADAGIVLPAPARDGRTAAVLAAALRTLAAAPELLEHLSQRARQRAGMLFREDRMIAEYLELIERGLGRREAPIAAAAPAPRAAAAAHHARRLIVAFYGSGEETVGRLLLDFFDTVPLFGRRSELCRIMTEQGSDKGAGWHNYTLLYDFLLRPRRYETERLFELGIGAIDPQVPPNIGISGRPGASLRAWRQYFPQAYIFGADIDKRSLFSEERISCYYVDQTNDQEIESLWQMISPPRQFDVMIDDGLHTFSANSCFMRNSIKMLRKYGFYVIEDIIHTQENLELYHDFFTDLGVPGAILRLPNLYNSYDNCLAIFRAG